MGARVSQHDLEGIIWTAIRAMMLDTDPELIAVDVECVKSVSHIMPMKERRHHAWDIRQNIEWNTEAFPYRYDAQAWWDLANWLDSGERHGKTVPVPRTTVSEIWFRFIRYSLQYICHSHSYASSYANDIAQFVPIMTQEQVFTLHEWLEENIFPTDDHDVRKLAAVIDPSNRYSVTASATKKQMQEWIARTPNVIATGAVQAVPETTYICFLFEGGYCNVDGYFKQPYRQGSIIEDFITKIEKLNK